MKVQFEFTPIPTPKGKENKPRYYPRVVNRKLVRTREITADIQQASSLTEGDVVAVLNSLNHFLSSYLMSGYRVHLEGLGYFDVSLTCPETHDPKKTRASSVRYKGINFLPDKELKYKVGLLKAERSNARRSSVAPLSEIAIDTRLTQYFEEHTVLTRYKMQCICSMTKISAIRCLHRLVDEGKLKNIGIKTQPIYVPVPGHYHVSADRE